MPPGPPPTMQQVVCSESRMDSEVSDLERGITSGAKDPPHLSGSRQPIYTGPDSTDRHYEKSGGIEFRRLGKKLMLSRGGFNRTSTFLIVVRYLIDPGTHRIASHKPRIPRL